MLCQGFLHFDNRRDCLGGARERNKESIALRVHLLPIPSADRLTKDFVVLFQESSVIIAKLFQQLRRILDVGEEKGNCAAGERIEKLLGAFYLVHRSLDPFFANAISLHIVGYAKDRKQIRLSYRGENE
jgi:hypothetical protein